MEDKYLDGENGERFLVDESDTEPVGQGVK